MAPQLTLYHCPYSRSTGVLTLLEELHAPYDLHVMNMKKGENREAAYLAVNPMGKVPAVRHGDAVITEQVAIYLYLADLFPDAKLAPPLGDPLRGPYLRWMAFYGSCFEPAVVDKWMKNAPADKASCHYGDFDTMFNTLIEQLSKGPYLLGERFSALDVLWASAMGWMGMYELLPKLPVIEQYVARVTSRPSFAAANAKDGELAAAQAAAA
ncbi:glutathione S-transferase family protein [Duganella sp. HH105]|uniref:glutathione S-transferase family protein n=1 Tax=Duganella sp. HH105 TaxID=1781067 RepID=UPI000877BEF6|nr:glutathione S-transferase [Duganella sp. HH105]OEZ59806.1 glutathione S-transferase GST-6.0 [Duganella sp. HH105]